MASLYIKDEETSRLAQELADRRKLTKTAAVRLALTNELAKDKPKRSALEIIEELRRTSTFRYDPNVVIGKAFYDSLYEDDDE
jgi:antitoxin VapB